MAWAVSKPEDWQLGGKCDAYLWGSGRHGQLCETGRAALTPHLTSSFKTAQQVMIVTLIAHFAAILLERVRVKIHCSHPVGILHATMPNFYFSLKVPNLATFS